MTLKIKLTEEGLWVNKYKCNSVTIIQNEEGFEASLFHIEGITKEVPKLNRLGRQEVGIFDKKPIFKTLRLKKTMKSKEINYEGLPLSKGKCNHAKNKKGNYVNLYYNSKDKICANCGHKKELHVLDSFGNPVCDKVIEYPNKGTYNFECDCKEFKED